MSLDDIRSFQGQPWSNFRRQVHHVYRKSSITQELRSNSIILKYEDRALYGKYPGFEPFVLALCGFCGEKFKIPVLARHIALKHSDGRVRENHKYNQKSDVKNANVYGKKSKSKAKKDVETPPQSEKKDLKDNKPSCKVNHNVNHQIDKRKLSQVPIFVSKHPSDDREEKSSIDELNNEKKISQNEESPQVQNTIDNNVKEYPTYLKPCSKESVVKSPDDHLFLSPSKEKYDSRRFRTKPAETAKRETDKFRVHNSHSAKERIIAAHKAVNDHYKAADVHNRVVGAHSRAVNTHNRIVNAHNRVVNAQNRVVNTHSRVGHHLAHNTHNDLKRRRVISSKSKVYYNPDLHCGVIGKENSKPCTRPLTCKSHTMSLRRAVRGRSKNFDQLLEDHHAEKGSPKHSINNFNHDVPPLPMEVTISPEMMKKLQLTPLKIPLVMNHNLSKGDSIIKNNILPSNNSNGDIIPCNPFLPYDVSQKRKKDATKRFRELRKNYIDFMKTKRYASKQPWYRKHGGLLYSQNNLPNLPFQKNPRKEKKKRKRKHLYSFAEREDDPKRNVANLRDLDTLCIQRRLRNPTIYDFKDWSVERKRQIVSPASDCTLKHYTLEEMQKVYFRMIPDTIDSPNINLQSEYLGVAYPPPVLKGSAGPENQFYVQKLRDYFCFDKYLTRLRRTKGGRRDRDERYFFRNIPDGNVMILEPIITRRPFYYPQIILEHLDSTPYRTVKVPTKEERTWNVAMGTWKGDGGVAVETLNRMHFITPSGPMSARFVQLPIYPDVVVPQATSEPGKSKVEE